MRTKNDKLFVALTFFLLIVITIIGTSIFSDTTGNSITGQVIRNIPGIGTNQIEQSRGEGVRSIPFRQPDENQDNIRQRLSDTINNAPQARADRTQQQGEDRPRVVFPNPRQRNGKNIHTPRFKIKAFRHGLSLYRKNGLPFIFSDEFELLTKLRLSIFKEGYPLSDFDIEFTNDVNLSDIVSGINFTHVKSFIHTDTGVMDNRTLYVPRRPEHTQVRVCSGAKDFNQIGEGCINSSGVTNEYVLSLGDPRLSMTDDEAFFIVHGITGTGAQSENNTRLIVYDDTDSQTRVPDQLVQFFANYSNRTDDRPINGSGTACNITFADTGTFNMTFDHETHLYTYNRTFNNPNVFFYNVTCNNSNQGFLDLLVNDYVSIQNELAIISGPDNITRGASERGPENTVGTVVQAEGRNLTSLALISQLITPSWQGFFGNITNSIVLEDANNNSIYDWNLAQPTGEVFASRAFDVNFPTMNCTTQEQIYVEELALGQTNLSADRVNITFNRTVHPAFTVGTAAFDADSCRSTNLFVNSAHQESNFYEIIMTDGAENTVYTAIVDADQIGFDGVTQDFQMIVGENAHDNDVPTNYYFFVELT